jgi:hypothetical protein
MAEEKPLPRLEDITIEIVSIRKPRWWKFFMRMCNEYEVTVRVNEVLMKVETYISDTPDEYNDAFFLERVREQVWRRLYGDACQKRTIERVTGAVIKLKKKESA